MFSLLYFCSTPWNQDSDSSSSFTTQEYFTYLGGLHMFLICLFVLLCKHVCVFLLVAENHPFEFWKDLYWNFDECYIKSLINFILILPIHEHGRQFHLLISSSNSFFSVLFFFSYKYLIWLLSLTSNRFCLLVSYILVIVKGLVSLISFLVSLLFIYRKVNNFVY